ncbi:uncharacterized protein MKK02DRAFT_32471 [Dioszegia hungarica]|uniref:EamA domain-containing protein n=1 Tax=Dioszegia hungarica TaxID=4972 RepID=A0AA38HAJ1_9TREE|nr:uncharacterized protein MKK02DRAFT_32471 [Dioszegia hungarica]KAI9637682.1 hypothetical protein MKK02DRAFT_32471 [Dioszegia hungarica]
MASLIQRYAGALLALLASLIFSLMNAQAQTCMRHGVSPGQVAFGRMLITVPLVTVYLMYIYLNWPPSYFKQLDPRKHAAQDGASNALDSAATIIDRNPALAACLIWLRSILTSIGLCFSFASMQLTSSLAVIRVVQSPFIFGAGVSEVPATRAAGFLFLVLIRFLGSGPDPLIMTLAYSIACLFVSPWFIFLGGETRGAVDGRKIYIDLLVLAAPGLFAQMYMVTAMQKETGETVSVALYAQIPFTVLVQSLLVGEGPGMLQVLGMAIIVSFGVWAIQLHLVLSLSEPRLRNRTSESWQNKVLCRQAAQEDVYMPLPSLDAEEQVIRPAQ